MFEKRIFPAITHLIYRINNTSILEEFSKSFIECFSQSKYFNTYSVYKLILYYNLGTFRNEVLKYNTIIYVSKITVILIILLIILNLRDSTHMNI